MISQIDTLNNQMLTPMHQELHEIDVRLVVRANCDSTIAIEQALRVALPSVAGVFVVHGSPPVMFHILECKTKAEVPA